MNLKDCFVGILLLAGLIGFCMSAISYMQRNDRVAEQCPKLCLSKQLSYTLKSMESGLECFCKDKEGKLHLYEISNVK